MLKLRLLIVIALGLIIIIPSLAIAQPDVCGFYGTVTLDRASVPDGTVVKAWIDQEEVKSAI